MRWGLVIAMLALAACSRPAPVGASVEQLPAILERHLRDDVLAAWYPRAVDPAGGFIQEFDARWRAHDDGARFLVYQARLTWSAAAAAERFPDLRADLLPIIRHGTDFLCRRLWDGRHGGFLWRVDRDGAPLGDRGDHKHLYGNAFAIYALAQSLRVDDRPEIRARMVEAFAWLEEHARDREHGGYIEALDREGAPLRRADAGMRVPRDVIGTRLGMKSMNAHIHALEALTALHRVHPAPEVRERLGEIHGVVLGRIAVDPGVLNQFFTRDWRPVPDTCSFGHNVETAFLLVESARELGRDDEAAWRMPRMLVDHALAYGWDDACGALHDSGTTFRDLHDRSKLWWVQAEALNALALMHRRYGSEDGRYGEALRRLWTFIDARLVDHDRGGWRGRLNADGAISLPDRRASPWQANYHVVRCLLGAIEHLAQ